MVMQASIPGYPVRARVVRSSGVLRLIIKPIEHVVQLADSVRGVLLLLRGAHRITLGPLGAHGRVVPLQVANGALNLPIVLYPVLRNDLVQLLL